MRGLWIGFAAISYGSTAHAAPWLRHQGEGYGRVAAAGERVAGLDAQRYDAYGEFGLTDKWTATAKAEIVTFPGNTDFNADGYRATVRRDLWSNDRFQLSGEVGAVYGAAIGGVDGCDTLGAEMRVGAGASGEWAGGEWFGFVDGARREHGEGCWRDRVEMGFGQEVAKNVYVINQIWLERGSAEAVSDKIETGILYRADRVDWSLSYRQETSGRFEEEGIVVALAMRF